MIDTTTSCFLTHQSGCLHLLACYISLWWLPSCFLLRCSQLSAVAVQGNSGTIGRFTMPYNKPTDLQLQQTLMFAVRESTEDNEHPWRLLQHGIFQTNTATIELPVGAPVSVPAPPCLQMQLAVVCLAEQDAAERPYSSRWLSVNAAQQRRDSSGATSCLIHKLQVPLCPLCTLCCVFCTFLCRLCTFLCLFCTLLCLCYGK